MNAHGERGPAYRAAQSRFIRAMSPGTTPEELVQALLRWDDTFDAAMARYIDARDAFGRTLGRATGVSRVALRLLAWINRNLKGDKSNV